MSEYSKKTKVIIVILLILLFLPIWLLGPGLVYFENKAWANDKLADSPGKIFFYARVYVWTQRQDKAQEICKKWLLRWGGDDSTSPDIEVRYINWEPPVYNQDNPRPAHYSHDPHPLTPQVLCMLADEIDLTVFHDRSNHLYKTIVEKFKNDPDAVKRAEAGMRRQQTRVIK